jgi:hypothetical protein
MYTKHIQMYESVKPFKTKKISPICKQFLLKPMFLHVKMIESIVKHD